MIAAVDPRSDNPFERAGPRAEPRVSIEELTTTFAETDLAETTALLAVLAHLGADEMIRARARRALADRRQPLPGWLSRLDEATVYRAAEMVHVLGDGDEMLLGLRLAAGQEITAVLYIDHNLGTAVKDAFPVPRDIAGLITFIRRKDDDPDIEWRDVALADARARITEAIEHGARMFPPLETETWPASRPLMEWLLRLLPEDGTGYVRPEWSEQARGDLAARFFGSAFGAELDDPDHRSLLDSILWFGADYGPGDPMRWSPVAVEILLADWIPRKIVADATFLSKGPGLLRAFIRFCHGERQIRATLTEETLAAVDHFEPEYQRVIRSPRPQGPEALLAAMGMLGPADERAAAPDGGSDAADGDPLRAYQKTMLSRLSDAVGGDSALDSLDDLPLPDEEFSWTGIPDDIRAQVTDVLTACDEFCDQALGIEYRTVCRRLLARAAAGGPDAFRCRAGTDTTAAAVCWLTGRANDLFGPDGGGWRVRDLMSAFGLRRATASQRAWTLLDAAGISRSELPGVVHFGTPDLLVSSRRRDIMAWRDGYRDALQGWAAS